MKKWYLAEFGAKNESYLRKLSETETRTIEAQKRIDGGNLKLKNSFSTLTSGLGVAGGIAGVSLLLNKGFESYRKLEIGMRNFNSIAKMNETQLKQTTVAVQQLSKKIGTPTSDLTGAMYQAVSAGVAVGDALAFTEIAAKTAAAGLTTAEVAVDGLTSVLNAFHKPATDAEKVADIMFQTVNLGKITFEELAGSIAEVAPLAASSGIEFEQIAAAIATLTKQGTKAPQALTQIRAAIIAMNDSLGDGWSKTMTLQEAMEKMREKAGGSNKELKNLVGRIEGVNAILGLTGDNLKMATEDLNAMKSATGEMGKAFKENTNTMQNKVDRLVASFEEMLINTVGNLEPAISGFIEFGNEGAKAISKIMNAFKKLQQDKEIWEAFTAAFKISTNSFVFSLGEGSQVRMTQQQIDQIRKADGTYKPDQGVVDKTGSFIKGLNPLNSGTGKAIQENEKNLKVVKKIYETEAQIEAAIKELADQKKNLVIGSAAYLEAEKEIEQLQSRIAKKTKSDIKEEEKLREEAFQKYLENLVAIEDFSNLQPRTGGVLGKTKTTKFSEDFSVTKEVLPTFEMNEVPVPNYEVDYSTMKDQQIEFFDQQYQGWVEQLGSLGELMNSYFEGISSAYDLFWNSLMDKDITGAERMAMIWDSLKQTVVSSLGEILKQTIVNWIKTTAIGDSFKALELAKGVTLGTQLALAYAPAAAYASTMSFGGAAVAGGTALAGTVSMAQLLAIPKFATGTDGFQSVPAGYPNDNYPILLKSGEDFSVRTPSQRSKDQEYLQQLGTKLDVLNANLVSKNFSPKINVPVEIDGRRISQTVVSNINKMEREGRQIGNY